MYNIRQIFIVKIFRFISNPASDYSTKKWAVDGLAYLTLDADVKEDLINDIDALTEMYALVKVCISNTIFSLKLQWWHSVFYQAPDQNLIQF